MTDQLVAHGAAVALAETDQDGRSWIEVVPTVTESRNGPWYFTVTADDLTVYAQSLERRPGVVPVDYDHAGDRGNGTRAAGWFTGQTRIVQAGDTPPRGEPVAHSSVWAEVQWTPRAVDEIRGGEFKFTSPVFTFKQRDPKTGLMTRAKEIVASTLTNRPHFKQMSPVLAADDLYDEATLEALAEVYDPRIAQLIRGALGTDLVAQARDLIDNPASTATTKKENTMELKALASVLGLAEDATEEQITAAVAAEKEKADTLAGKVASLEAAAADSQTSSERIAELEAKLEAQAAERVAEKIDLVLAAAVTEGRIVPASKDTLAEQFNGNLDGLEAVLATMPVRPGLVGHGGTGDPVPGSTGPALVTTGEPVLGEDLHQAALKILAEKGDNPDDPDAYAAALVQADLQLAVR